jgi:hypothetical protein
MIAVHLAESARSAIAHVASLSSGPPLDPELRGLARAPTAGHAEDEGQEQELHPGCAHGAGHGLDFGVREKLGERGWMEVVLVVNQESDTVCWVVEAGRRMARRKTNRGHIADDHRGAAAPTTTRP